MRYILLFLFIILTFCLHGQNKNNFQEYFTEDATLRLDFILAGNAENSEIYLYDVKREKPWAGPLTNHVEPFFYGNYRIMVKSNDGDKIYHKGFSTLFEEYQTTDKSREEKKAFYHTIRIPFPLIPVNVSVQERNYDTGEFEDILTKRVEPGDYFINEEKASSVDYEKVLESGSTAKCVDIAFLAEGYKQQEMDKFVDDVERIMDYILSQEPFDKYQDRFNVYAVKSVSKDSGTDVPGEGVYKNTALNSSYYTFDVPRYLTSKDTRTIRDYASAVPYDHIFILINTDRYGGGGFYNHYTASTEGHAYSMEVAIHEFGHGFAGLGDEYYESDVAYSEFYNKDVEPWEPNLTTLVDFDKKWKGMIAENTPVPTPREPEYKNTIGVFEGGGYVSEDVYSPSMDCRMKSNEASGFCPVCQKAIENVILYYLDE
ncbi:MAG: M64 family metallopeptidase [Bacteroidales bacterium]